MNDYFEFKLIVHGLISGSLKIRFSGKTAKLKPEQIEETNHE